MIIGSKLLECNLEVSLLQLVIASINHRNMDNIDILQLV